MAISFIGTKIFRFFCRDAHADATICCLPASGQQILTVVTSAKVWFRKNWFRRCAPPWNRTRSWCGAASFVVIGAALRLFSCVKRTNGGQCYAVRLKVNCPWLYFLSIYGSVFTRMHYYSFAYYMSTNVTVTMGDMRFIEYKYEQYYHS